MTTSPCCFFLHDRCQKGTACQFAHTRDVSGGCSFGAKCTIPAHRGATPRAPARAPPRGPPLGPTDGSQGSGSKACCYFLQGKCDKGAACSFAHTRDVSRGCGRGVHCQLPGHGPQAPGAAPAAAPGAAPGAAPPAAHAPTPGPKACCYFLQDRCRFGTACQFAHTRDVSGGCSFGAKCTIPAHRGAAPPRGPPLGPTDGSQGAAPPRAPPLGPTEGSQGSGLKACCYFLQGKCDKGSACRFAHTRDVSRGCGRGVHCQLPGHSPPGAAPDAAHAPMPGPKACCYFLQGNCGHGATCKFAHTMDASGGCARGVHCGLHSGAPAPVVPPAAATPAPQPYSAEAALQPAEDDGSVLVQYRLRPRSKPLDLCAVVDRSGSMRDAPLRIASSALAELFRDVLQDDDCFALVSFADSVQVHHGFAPRRLVDIDADLEDVRRAPRGRTALWDAIARGRMLVERHHAAAERGSVKLQLVLTDGEDTHSVRTAEHVRDLVASTEGLPDYHLVLIAVGLDAPAVSTMRAVCAAPHARVIELTRMDQLAATLRELRKEFVADLEVVARGRRWSNSAIEVDAEAARKVAIQLGAHMNKAMGTGGLGTIESGARQHLLNGAPGGPSGPQVPRGPPHARR